MRHFSLLRTERARDVLLFLCRTNAEITKDDIVVEMKTNTETVLLKAVNGGEGMPNDKVSVRVEEQDAISLRWKTRPCPLQAGIVTASNNKHQTDTFMYF